MYGFRKEERPSFEGLEETESLPRRLQITRYDSPTNGQRRGSCKHKTTLPLMSLDSLRNQSSADDKAFNAMLAIGIAFANNANMVTFNCVRSLPRYEKPNWPVHRPSSSGYLLSPCNEEATIPKLTMKTGVSHVNVSTIASRSTFCNRSCT